MVVNLLTVSSSKHMELSAARMYPGAHFWTKQDPLMQATSATPGREVQSTP